MYSDKSIEDIILMTINNLSNISRWEKQVNYKQIIENLDKDIISTNDIWQYHLKLHQEGFIIIHPKHAFYLIELTPKGIGRVSHIKQILTQSKSTPMPNLENFYFLSHSSNDKHFARRLAEDLRKENFEIFLDEWNIDIGESIVGRINDALERMQGLIIILSNNSINSEWVKKELSSALMKKLSNNTITIIPVLKENCKIPIIIQDYKYANFINNYHIGLSQLINYLRKNSS